VKRLLIISNMAHYVRDGVIVGWGPTVQEIDELSRLFEAVDHIACLHSDVAPASALAYSANNVRLIPVSPMGGKQVRDKLGILAAFPGYALTISRGLRSADVVHVRCPANISLLAIVMLWLRRGPTLRWIKYAGEWERKGPEPRSYAFQRWWLKRALTTAFVSVNGNFEAQPSHVRTFYNPCLGEAELALAARLVLGKPSMPPQRLLFVGSITANKGVLRALDIVRRVRDAGVRVTLEVVGDGEEMPLLKRGIAEHGMGGLVTLHGWLPRTALGEVYARNHLLLMTSTSEGWPKVLSEAMAYGVVPIASAISCVPQYFREFQVGRTAPCAAPAEFAQAAVDYARDPGMWRMESQRAMAAAKRFTYRHYLRQVQELLWGKRTVPVSCVSQTET
jgi:glycosyltransferase involved in cell wall biosynthesis